MMDLKITMIWLQRFGFYKIPTTFYVSTAYIGKKKMFWVDILEDIFNKKVQNKIEIKLNRGYIFDTSTKYKN